nr:FAD-dependent monooxygenase [Betaproteobacteria bacterium]
MPHDIVIVGAGPVGGAFALALADADLDVVALDSRAEGEAARTDRSLALSHGARLIFERLGVWRRLAAIPEAVTPITVIDISQAGGFGCVRLSADEQELPALGYVVSYRALQNAIDAALKGTRTTIRYGTTAVGISSTSEHAAITIDRHEPEPIVARLAVVADGANLAVKGITRERRDYAQVALIAKVWTERAHGGVAYERFASDGPMALLPERDHYGLVWTLPPTKADAMLALSDAAFLAALAEHFGTRVTGFARIADRRKFPLALEFARPLIAVRTVVIGNAAQALHPIAGQGFNLGMRDAYELARVIIATPRDRLGEHTMLEMYATRRRGDRYAGIAFTHGLTQLFALGLPFVRWPRG